MPSEPVSSYLDKAVELIANRDEKRWVRSPKDPAYTSLREAIRRDLQDVEPFIREHERARLVEHPAELIAQELERYGSMSTSRQLRDCWNRAADVARRFSAQPVRNERLRTRLPTEGGPYGG